MIPIPGDGGPDEVNHFGLIQQMAEQRGWREFGGYNPGALAGGPVRGQVAYDITPNITAVLPAALLALMGGRDVAFEYHTVRMFHAGIFTATLFLAYLTLCLVFARQ